MASTNRALGFRREIVWLPSLDTFRTLLSDCEANYLPLKNLLCIAPEPHQEALHA